MDDRPEELGRAPLCGPPLAGADAIDAVLDRVRLTEVADLKVKTYSQGCDSDSASQWRSARSNAAPPPTSRQTGWILPASESSEDCSARSPTRGRRSSSQAICSLRWNKSAIASGADRGRVVEEGKVSKLTAGRPRVRVAPEEADQPRARTFLAAWLTRTDGPDALTGRERGGARRERSVRSG